jgi:uncharacterized membrane protein YhaH (DUF805 family)
LSWYLHVLKNYATFSGRARRREYWMFVFYHVAAYLVLWLLIMAVSLPFRDSITGDGGAVIVLPLALYYVGTALPAIAVTVRRLHDTNKSGGWFFVAFIPGGVGAIWMLIMMSQEGDPYPNRYGADPKAPVGFQAAPPYQQPAGFPGQAGHPVQPGYPAPSGFPAQPAHPVQGYPVQGYPAPPVQQPDPGRPAVVPRQANPHYRL